MRKVKTNIEEVKINDLKDHPKNPKKHDEEFIKKSIEELGDLSVITVDENNTILAGHGRVKALKDLGEKEITVKKVFGLTEKEKEKYLIIDNQSTMLKGFDDDLLKGFDNDILADCGIDLLTDLEVDEFFREKTEEEKQEDLEKSKQRIICPHCGKEI